MKRAQLSQLEWERCRRDAQFFVFESGLRTKDEHDVVNPLKPFPDTLYLRAVLDTLLVSGRLLPPSQARYALESAITPEWLMSVSKSGVLLLEKSRQVMVTWLCCAYLLWRAKFHDHQLLLVQSKREDDAANLVFNKDPHVARISFLEYALPPTLRSVQFPKAGAYGLLYFPNGSRIWGIPEGADIIRSNTPSVVFSDESAFQPQFGDSFTAALPCIKGGGQYIAVSSANPGEFCNLVEGIS